jgi:hypothetical protein
MGWIFLYVLGAAGIYYLASQSKDEGAPSGGGNGGAGDQAGTLINSGGTGIDQSGGSKDTSTSTEPVSEAPGGTPTGTPPAPDLGIPNDSVYPFVAVVVNVKGAGGAPVQIFTSSKSDDATKAKESENVSWALAQYINAKKLDSKNGISAYTASLSATGIDPMTEGPASSLYRATKAETAAGTGGFYVFFIKDWQKFLENGVGTRAGLPPEIIAYTATRAAVRSLATPDSGLAAVVFPEDLA